jgi:hypothetical protein
MKPGGLRVFARRPHPTQGGRPWPDQAIPEPDIQRGGVQAAECSYASARVARAAPEPGHLFSVPSPADPAPLRRVLVHSELVLLTPSRPNRSCGTDVPWDRKSWSLRRPVAGIGIVEESFGHRRNAGRATDPVSGGTGLGRAARAVTDDVRAR